MTRIAILISDITTVGGTERVATTIANKLSEGNDITVFSLNNKNKSPFYNISDNIDIRFAKSKKHLPKIISMAFTIKKMRFDKIVIFSMGRLSFEFSLLFYILGVRNVYLSEHVSFDAFSGWKKILKIFAYKLSYKIGVLTDIDVKNLRRNGLANVMCLPNISPFEDIVYDNTKTIDYDLRDKVVIAIGRMTYQKNFQEMIRIWSKVNSTGWRLIIIGDGPDKDELLRIIDELSITNIELHPFSTNINNYYEQARLILLTSRYEGLPMVLIEAQSFSVPAIAFDCPTGPSQIIKDQFNGFLIEQKDTNSFITNLDFLLGDEMVQKKMSINSLDNAKQFTSEKIIPLWLDFLEI